MGKIKDCGTKMMERIKLQLYFIQEETITAWKYVIVLMISLKIDNMYAKHLSTLSLIFGIINLCLAYNIYIYAKKILLMPTFINGKFVGIYGISKIILLLLGLYHMMISVISIAYDVYEIIFVHILGRVL